MTSGSSNFLRLVHLIFFFLVFFATIFCEDCSAASTNSSSPSDEINFQNVSTGISQFSADFYTAAKTAGKEKSRNWVFSPFSLSTAFAMLKVGTAGDTSGQLEKVFHYQSTKDAALAAGFHAILQTLNGVESSPDFNLTTANRLYIDNKFEVLSSYQNILENSFDSGIERVKLDSAAADVINKWVENVTHDKIRDLISPEDLNPSLHPKFVLVNAIYFLGRWKHPFKMDNTRDQKFFLSERANDFVEVEMMHQDLTLQITFLKDVDADVFLLPYKGGRFSMLVYLPRNQSGLSKIESNLKSIPSLSQLGPQLRASRFALAFPKFHIETTIDATSILPQLGVNLIFSSEGDFSKITLNSSEPLSVSKAVQKAVIIVDEEGTEAAAATAVAANAFSMPIAPPPLPELVVDHPFYYQIIDGHNSDLILFAGSCVNPSERN